MMYKNQRTLQVLGLLLMALLYAPKIQAQEKWDLQRCIDYAVEQNLQLKIAKIQQDINEANLLQSRVNRLPNLNANGSQQWNFGRSIDFFTNTFTNQQVANFNTSINTNFTVFNGFRQINTIKQNVAILDASRSDVAQVKNDMMLDIANAYLTILFNRELLGVARVQLQNTQEQLDRTMRLIDAGALAEANKYDILSQKANDENRITQAENNVDIALVRLKILLQLPVETPIEIVIPQLADPNAADLIMTPLSVYELAQGTQPNVMSADKNIEAADLGIAIARGNYMPTLSGFGTVLTGTSSQNFAFVNGVRGDLKPFGQQIDENLRQVIGFQLQIPIFNRFQIRNAVTTARLQHNRSQLQAQNVRNVLRQTIEQAYADAKAAQRSFISNQTRLAALTQSQKIVEERFNVGAANSLDYALAKNNLAIAESELIRSKFDYIFRIKVLDFYAGKGLTL